MVLEAMAVSSRTLAVCLMQSLILAAMLCMFPRALERFSLSTWSSGVFLYKSSNNKLYRGTRWTGHNQEMLEIHPDLGLALFAYGSEALVLLLFSVIEIETRLVLVRVLCVNDENRGHHRENITDFASIRVPLVQSLFQLRIQVLIEGVDGLDVRKHFLHLRFVDPTPFLVAQVLKRQLVSLRHVCQTPDIVFLGAQNLKRDLLPVVARFRMNRGPPPPPDPWADFGVGSIGSM